MMFQSMAPLIIGMCAGLLSAAVLTRFLRAYLFEVSPLDPAMFVIVGVFLGVASLFANLLPILRSASADPLLSLRGSNRAN